MELDLVGILLANEVDSPLGGASRTLKVREINFYL